MERKEYKIRLYRDELLYDVKQTGYVEGDVMKEEEQDGKHQTQDIGEEGNVDLITRYFDLAHAIVLEELFPISKRYLGNGGETDIDATELAGGATCEIHEEGCLTHREKEDDKLKERPYYYIGLSVEEKFSMTTLNLIARLAHEFMVAYALWRWLGITKPQAAPKWEKAAAEAQAGLKDLAKKGGAWKGRRVCRPF